VVGVPVAMVGTFVGTGVPRVGNVGTVSDGAIGAITEGKFGYISRGFRGAATEGLFGTVLVSGRAVVGLTVSLVGLFCSTGAKTEGILGVIADGVVIGAKTDGKFGYIRRGFCGAETEGLFGAILDSG